MQYTWGSVFDDFYDFAGKVGDWKSHFTVAQNEVMDALIREKLAGSGLTFDYE